MPRPRYCRAQEPQKQSPRPPPNLRTSSSDSDQQHPRPRNPKPTDGRSIRAVQSDPSNQKKLGTRIANLESQLGLAQEELKSLKDQLLSTESAKKSAQEKHSTYETSDDNIQKETDVFEVPVEKLAEVEIPDDEDEMKSKENPPFDELASKNDEINLLKADLDDKDKELENFRRDLDEKSLKIDELTMRLTNISQELEKSKANAVEMNEKLEFTEKAKEELENEMKRLRVQSEQWRKAADAAASVLAGGMEINGRRLSDQRYGSMDKVYTNSFEHVGGYGGSPGLGDDVFVGGEKRKDSGIRMWVRNKFHH